MPEPTARADRTVDDLDRLIGARIRQERLGEGLRKHKPWTALVLLERVNRPEAGGDFKLDPNVVRRIESGERPLRASQLVAFARALGVGVESLYEPLEDEQEALEAEGRANLAWGLERVLDGFQAICEGGEKLARAEIKAVALTDVLETNREFAEACANAHPLAVEYLLALQPLLTDSLNPRANMERARNRAEAAGKSDRSDYFQQRLNALDAYLRPLSPEEREAIAHSPAVLAQAPDAPEQDFQIEFDGGES